jgi:hypothetical protein
MISSDNHLDRSGKNEIEKTLRNQKRDRRKKEKLMIFDREQFSLNATIFSLFNLEKYSR